MTNPSQPTRNIPPGDTSRPGVLRTPQTRPAGTPPSGTHPRTPCARSPGVWNLATMSWPISSHEHRYLTTAQITAILFTSERTCRNRLNVLRKIGFIDWFMPVRPGAGRLPVHWVPGPLSARYVALHHGERPPTRESGPRSPGRPGLRRAPAPQRRHQPVLRRPARPRPRGIPTRRLARWWSGRAHRRQGQTQRPPGRARRLVRGRPAGGVLPGVRHRHARSTRC